MTRCVARLSISVFALGMLAATTVVQADQNYVPRGHAWAPGDVFLPPLNSEQDRINAMADAREAELQREMREQRIFEEQFRMMIDLHEWRPGRSYEPY
jgi:hypothetical protein